MSDASRSIGTARPLTHRLVWCVVMTLMVMLVGCSGFSQTRFPPQEPQYSLTGRLRISTEDSILRLNFRLAAEQEATHLHFWGPLGVRYGEAKVTPNQVEFVSARGERRIFNAAEIDQFLPGGSWLLSNNLGSWLLLDPGDEYAPQALQRWTIDGVSGEVVKRQLVGDKTVCKQLALSKDTLKVVIFCDRWRFDD